MTVLLIVGDLFFISSTLGRHTLSVHRCFCVVAPCASKAPSESWRYQIECSRVHKIPFEPSTRSPLNQSADKNHSSILCRVSSLCQQDPDRVSRPFVAVLSVCRHSSCWISRPSFTYQRCGLFDGILMTSQPTVSVHPSILSRFRPFEYVNKIPRDDIYPLSTCPRCASHHLRRNSSMGTKVPASWEGAIRGTGRSLAFPRCRLCRRGTREATITWSNCSSAGQLGGGLA